MSTSGDLLRINFAAHRTGDCQRRGEYLLQVDVVHVGS